MYKRSCYDVTESHVKQHMSLSLTNPFELKKCLCPMSLYFLTMDADKLCGSRTTSPGTTTPRTTTLGTITPKATTV